MIDVVWVGPVGHGKVILDARDRSAIAATVNELLEQGIADARDGRATTIEIEPARMSQSEFDALPEFGGW